MSHRALPYVLVGGALLCLGAGAFATDGVIEINQARALAGGVTPGDTPGFPVTLDQSGSYRLTSNLDLTVLAPGVAENTTAIQILGLFTVATIDLNGFAIVGPTFCTASCSPVGTGQGVTSMSSDQTITLRNGVIRGMGAEGTGFFAALVENVTAEHNGGRAFFVQGGVVRDSIASRNGIGIDAPGSFVSGCSSRNNLSDGIRAMRIERSVAIANTGDGFEATGYVSDSMSADNGGAELACETLCPLSGNHFGGCSGSGCFGGAGTWFQAPAASNSCGGALCP